MKFVQQRNSSMELRLLVFEVVGSLILLAAEFFFKLRMVTLGAVTALPKPPKNTAYGPSCGLPCGKKSKPRSDGRNATS